MGSMSSESPGMLRFLEGHHETVNYGHWWRIRYVGIDPVKTHYVITKSNPVGAEDFLVRPQSKCTPGSLGVSWGEVTCECHDQLRESMRIIDDEGAGMVLYLDEEGRGQGLVNKVRALALKNQGYDTFEAVERLGLEPDIRDHKTTPYILGNLGVSSVCLMTNNPDKIQAVEEAGITVAGIMSIEIPATEHTAPHLKAKRDRGHLLTQSFE